MTTPRTPRPTSRAAGRPVNQRVFGTAGASVAAHTNAYGAKGKAGAVGEQRTAAQLNTLAANDPHLYVFHDVKMPGVAANIDHLLVRGNRVLIVDSKVAKPGFYWTLFGVTRRGLAPATHLDKQGVQMYQRKVRETVTRFGLPATAVTSVFVLRPAGTGLIRCWAMRLRDGVASVPHTSLRRFVTKHAGTGPTTDNSALIAWARSLPKAN